MWKIFHTLRNRNKNIGRNLQKNRSVLKQPSQKRILVTAFEKFGGRKENASEKILQLLKKNKIIRNELIVFCVLPVHWEKSVRTLGTQIQKYNPQYIIMLGEAGDNCIRIEKQASSVNGLHTDNSGKLPAMPPNKKRKTLAKSSLKSLIKLKKEFIAQNLPCVYSNHAGDFLCNYVYYHSLKTQGNSRQTVFIHIPISFQISPQKNFHSALCAEALATFIRKLNLDV